jgi:hypothetical protein
MTKTSKSILFFMAVISLACGVIYAGQQYSEKAEINWIIVGLLVAGAAFVLLLTVVVPDIEGPGQGLGLSGGSEGDSVSGDSAAGDES